jgi:hypothetical protein
MPAAFPLPQKVRPPLALACDWERRPYVAQPASAHASVVCDRSASPIRASLSISGYGFSEAMLWYSSGAIFL